MADEFDKRGEFVDKMVHFIEKNFDLSRMSEQCGKNDRSLIEMIMFHSTVEDVKYSTDPKVDLGLKLAAIEKLLNHIRNSVGALDDEVETPQSPYTLECFLEIYEHREDVKKLKAAKRKACFHV